MHRWSCCPCVSCNAPARSTCVWQPGSHRRTCDWQPGWQTPSLASHTHAPASHTAPRLAGSLVLGVVQAARIRDAAVPGSRQQTAAQCGRAPRRHDPGGADEGHAGKASLYPHPCAWECVVCGAVRLWEVFSGVYRWRVGFSLDVFSSVYRWRVGFSLRTRDARRHCGWSCKVGVPAPSLHFAHCTYAHALARPMHVLDIDIRVALCVCVCARNAACTHAADTSTRSGFDDSH